MATPTQRVKELVKIAAEYEGMSFFYGNEADAWLDKLTEGVNENLNSDGYCLLRDLPGKIKQLGNDWQLIPCIITLCKQDIIGSNLLTAREDIRIAMYNQWIDVMEYIRDNNADETEIQEGWTYDYFDYGDNVCSGILVEFNMLINGYC